MPWGAVQRGVAGVQGRALPNETHLYGGLAYGPFCLCRSGCQDCIVAASDMWVRMWGPCRKRWQRAWSSRGRAVTRDAPTARVQRVQCAHHHARSNARSVLTTSSPLAADSTDESPDLARLPVIL